MQMGKEGPFGSRELGAIFRETMRRQIFERLIRRAGARISSVLTQKPLVIAR